MLPRGERDPSQGAPCPTSVLVLLARHEFKQKTNTESGNERASLFTKHTITKLQAGTHKFVGEFVNKFVLYTWAEATSWPPANLSTLTIGVQGLYTSAGFQVPLFSPWE